MIIYTDDASNRVLQTYIPILPKHIWGKMDYKQIGDDKFDLPDDGSGLVGSGPYLAVEWKTGEEIRFKRNPNYGGHKGVEDEIVFRFFKTNESMVQALKAGEIDYAHNVSPEQFKALKGEPNIQAVNGVLNGWTELGFNTYGTGTGKTIKGGGPSTKALLDPAFRDALGYAIDKQKLDRQRHRRPRRDRHRPRSRRPCPASLGIRPGTRSRRTSGPSTSTWPSRSSTRPTTCSTRPVAGSTTKGKPISLSLVMPDSDANYAKAGAVHHRLVRPARDQGQPAGSRQRHALRADAPTGGRQGRQGGLRPVHLGLVVGSGPE